MPNVYLDTDHFNQLAEKIAALEPSAFAGHVTADQVKLALGEHGDIWPKRIRADAQAMENHGRP